MNHSWYFKDNVGIFEVIDQFLLLTIIPIAHHNLEGTNVIFWYLQKLTNKIDIIQQQVKTTIYLTNVYTYATSIDSIF